MGCDINETLLLSEIHNFQSLELEYIYVDHYHRNVSFFQQDLNQNINEDQKNNQNERLKDNLLVGILFDGYTQEANNISKYFKYLLKNNIYYLSGFVLEGINNTIQQFQDNLRCIDQCSKLIDKSYIEYENLIQNYLTMNMMMRIDKKIYLFQPCLQQKQIWGMKVKGEQTYREIKEEDLERISDYCFELKDTNNIEEILLSDSKNKWEQISKTTLKQEYPKYNSFQLMHFLRIKLND